MQKKKGKTFDLTKKFNQFCLVKNFAYCSLTNKTKNKTVGDQLIVTIISYLLYCLWEKANHLGERIWQKQISKEKPKFCVVHFYKFMWNCLSKRDFCQWYIPPNSYSTWRFFPRLDTFNNLNSLCRFLLVFFLFTNNAFGTQLAFLKKLVDYLILSVLLAIFQQIHYQQTRRLKKITFLLSGITLS